MKSYGLNALRTMYLDFFKTKAHLVADSFPLVPQNDKSLLLVNAGMAPLKPYFTGQAVPPSNRMATCQKCIRTGDIENVGKTDRHLTFFEMLGNFSFGDYFKEDAIVWAWEFFTDVLAIPKDLLYASVYEEDDEALDLWKSLTDIDPSHVVKMGKADNFWEHGTGPCGPSSEIYFDRGSQYGCDDPNCTVGCECDRFVEVWNLVFTQFEKTEDGKYLNLPSPNIDTGMGLERLAVVLQDVDSVFNVDTMRKILESVCTLARYTYKTDRSKDISVRLITDHIRSVTFMTSDGIMPSNEGRGYVLRRLLRRAARHGRLLGIEGMFLEQLAKVVIELSGEAYPELNEKSAYILKILSVEEARFNETIDQGLAILEGYVDDLETTKSTTLAGDLAFKLYDTYGFPLDLTLEILSEKGLSVDEVAFKAEMEAQRNRAREAREETNYMGAAVTVYNQLDPKMVTAFNGYQTTNGMGTILALATEAALVPSVSTDQKVSIFVDSTPFYATSGGQEHDFGVIEGPNGIATITDVKKVMGDKIAHVGQVDKGSFAIGDAVVLSVDEAHRYATAKNHSTTHLLQKALKNIVGEHVEQAGSSVSADRLRFDFTHFEGLTKEQLQAVEDEVNDKIRAALSITVKDMTIEDAKAAGAMALFGEKYGDTVRVVAMGDYSMELCGGTHLSNTSEAGMVKILSEQGVAAGIRRIEALTAEGALNYYKQHETTINTLAGMVKCDSGAVVQKVNNLLNDLKALQQENEKLKAKLTGAAASDLMEQAITIKGMTLLAAQVPDLDMNALRDLGDRFRAKLDNGVVVLASVQNDKVNLIAMASDEAMAQGAHAGNLIKAIAPIVGGGGGGRPNMAQAGGKDPSKVQAALDKVKELL